MSSQVKTANKSAQSVFCVINFGEELFRINATSIKQAKEIVWDKGYSTDEYDMIIPLVTKKFRVCVLDTISRKLTSETTYTREEVARSALKDLCHINQNKDVHCYIEQV